MIGGAAAILRVSALAAGIAPQLEPAAAIEEDTSDPLVIAGTSLAIAGVLGAWGYGAWWNEDLVPFHFKDTGFLGRDTYAGGADKVGHFYVCSIATRAVTKLYAELGMTHRGAALLSAGAVTLVSNGIEVMDGFTSYGFEYEDVVANALGTAFGLASELSPAFGAIAGMRIAYVPSRDFLAGDKTFIKWINDYTGMSFYLDVKAKGVLEALGRDPGAARFLTFGLVYGSSKYSPKAVPEERRRSFGVHIGVSLPEVLRSAFPADEGVEAYATFFDYYALPFLSIAVLTDLNSGAWFVSFGVSNRLELGL